MDRGVSPERESGAPAVTRAIRILDLMSGSPEGRTLTEIATVLKLNKSSCYNILQALVSSGVVVKDSRSGLYRLGPKLIELGTATRRNTRLHHGFAEMARPLVDEIGVACVVAQVLPNHHGAVVLDRVLPSKDETLRVAIGHIYPLSAPAIGRAVLAYEDAEGTDLSTLGIRTNTKRFLQGVEEARRVGYGVSMGEVNENVRAIAAAVLAPDGEPAFVLMMAGSREVISEEQISDVGERLRSLADQARGLLITPYGFQTADA